MRVLVTGGTGTVGSHVVRELAEQKADMAVLTRDKAKASNLPAGVTGVEGDLGKPASVRQIFSGVDAVFLLNPVSPTESHEALLAITAMRDAGVKRIVYLSVQDADKAPWLPHFGSKVGVEAALRASGIAFTILRPNNFFQNDYWMKDALLQHGVYATPLGSAGVSRVDVRDIAEIAARALLTADLENQAIEINGPEALTGEAVTQAWGRALARPITYGGDDLDAWEQQMLQFMPDWMVYDFRNMFEYFQRHGLQPSRESLQRQTDILGHPPRSFDTFVAETAAAWK